MRSPAAASLPLTEEMKQLEETIKGLKSELDKAKKDSAKALAEVEANFKSELAAKIEELKGELLAQGSKDAQAALEQLKDRLAKDKLAALEKLQVVSFTAGFTACSF